MSKPVAGTAILMLVEEEGAAHRPGVEVHSLVQGREGRRAEVGAAAPVGGPAPAAPASPETYLVPPAREVTILDLLTHTSGLMSGPVGNAAGAQISANRRVEGLKYTEALGTTPLESSPVRAGPIAPWRVSTC